MKLLRKRHHVQSNSSCNRARHLHDVDMQLDWQSPKLCQMPELQKIWEETHDHDQRRRRQRLLTRPHPSHPLPSFGVPSLQIIGATAPSRLRRASCVGAHRTSSGAARSAPPPGCNSGKTFASRGPITSTRRRKNTQTKRPGLADERLATITKVAAFVLELEEATWFAGSIHLTSRGERITLQPEKPVSCAAGRRVRPVSNSWRPENGHRARCQTRLGHVGWWSLSLLSLGWALGCSVPLPKPASQSDFTCIPVPHLELNHLKKGKDSPINAVQFFSHKNT